MIYFKHKNLKNILSVASSYIKPSQTKEKRTAFYLLDSHVALPSIRTQLGQVDPCRPPEVAALRWSLTSCCALRWLSTPS